MAKTILMGKLGKASARRGTTGAYKDKACEKRREASSNLVVLPICCSNMRQYVVKPILKATYVTLDGFPRVYSEVTT